MSEYDVITTISDVLYFEEDQGYSKEIITVAATFTAAIGEVLGKITSSGEYAPLDPVATDGTEVAAAVAIGEKIVAAGTAEVMVLFRHSIVNESGLTFPSGITAPQKATALDQLKALGILLK